MKQLHRFIIISIALITSTIVIHSIKAPQQVPLKEYRVACIPASEAAAADADKNLIPYAQIAHTSSENLRCYFRFSIHDVVCIPKSVAARQQKVNMCPQFPTIDGTPHKFCYLLNKKHAPLSEELKKKPAISAQKYIPNRNVIVRTWQQVRDILLGGSTK